MLNKERKNWFLFWQGELEPIDHRILAAAPILAKYYLVSYAIPWVESIYKDAGIDTESFEEEMNLELAKLASLGIQEQTEKINKGLKEFDDKLLADLPENVEFLRVKSFSVGCARFLCNAFIDVEAGESTEGLTQDLGRAIVVDRQIAKSYSKILSDAESSERANEFLHRIYKAHRGFFLALREI